MGSAQRFRSVAYALGKRGRAEARRDSGPRTIVDESLDLKLGGVEVEEEAESEPGRAKVRDQGRSVVFVEVLDGLELDDHAALNQEVKAVVPEISTLVAERNRDLTFELKPPQLQLDRESLLIDPLEKPRPQPTVDLDGCPNHSSRPLRSFHAQTLRSSALPRFPSATAMLSRAPFKTKGPTWRGQVSQAGFTLLECMIALLLLATSAVILVQAQTAAVNMQEDASRLGVATMLGRQLMTDLELLMEKEGFGEQDVKETGDFSEDAFDGQFDNYRWEYEVEKVDLDIPNLSNLMNMMGGDDDDEGTGTGGGTGAGAQPPNQLEALSGMGVDFSFMSEMLANYLREARVRVCWKIRERDPFSIDNEECLEFITHLTNPTGKVTASGDDDDDATP